MGVSQEDTNMARTTQNAQRRIQGAQVLSIAAIIGIT